MNIFEVGDRVRVLPFSEIALSPEEDGFVSISDAGCFGLGKTTIDNMSKLTDVLIYSIACKADNPVPFYKLCDSDGVVYSFVWAPCMLEHAAEGPAVEEPAVDPDVTGFWNFILG